jgi:hypothetical protein
VDYLMEISMRTVSALRRAGAVLLAVATIFPATTAAALGGTPLQACDDLRHAVEVASPGALLLPSFPSAPDGPLHQAAFLYDNAATVLALIGCGDVAAARRIGDALVYAQSHDRFWHDGRLRNGYAAGPVGDGAMKLAGWWDKASQSWLEDRYQAGSDSGNLAWVLLALLALDQSSAMPGKSDYLKSAIQLAIWLRQNRDTVTDTGDPGGFRGGTFGHEPKPDIVTWKSTEHNTDLAAAYARLAKVTGDSAWVSDATAASTFVTTMWQADKSCFATGTGTDGRSRNDFVALDAQIWPLLALRAAAERRDAITQHCLPRLMQQTDYGDGYAYSAALHGIWTEGTAQAALLMRLTGDGAKATDLLTTIDKLRAPAGGFYATDQADLPTGFMLPTDPGKPRLYFHLPHLGATAWVALAQSGFNPFTATRSLP